MAAHSFTLVPAAYVYLLRPAPDSPRDRDGAASASTQVLLQLRRNTGYMDGHWACGASGHVEAAESVVETALRETREELGLAAAAADLNPLTAMHRSNDLGGAALEQRVLRWFPLTGLPDLVPPHERYVLTLLAGALDGGTPVPPITTFGFDTGQDIAHYGVALPH